MTDARAGIVIDSFWPMLKGGLYYSIPLAIVSFVIGLMIALGVALIRIFPRTSIIHHILYTIAKVYVSAIRGTPMLVQLFIIFYGLPNLGIKLEPVPSAIIAFSLNVGAYASETVRASILSIPKGQWEAGTSVGLTRFQSFLYVILPQALRVSIPPLSNTFIGLVKETSLASLVLVTELFKQAQIITARNYEFMLVYIEAAILYWVICFILTLIQERLEHHFDKHIAK
ncbi:amino acid ABC transporter permease [Moraxella nasovis]|uniref:amino acid ABC transporter permease n=1 Tax=Moraxella nasovis TaxID=2904121 RepID=UPI001F609BF5|nr:amino acid ABC transporter permease [Moraxella nasovis]UNU74301.1 amino acid ABC transporter permease [Moraxella nasovis]